MSRIPGIDLSSMQDITNTVIHNAGFWNRREPLQYDLPHAIESHEGKVEFVERDTPGAIPVLIEFPDGSQLRGFVGQESYDTLRTWIRIGLEPGVSVAEGHGRSIFGNFEYTEPYMDLSITWPVPVYYLEVP